ncbi:dUTP diphosphatase [Candidatus Woesearchaeota archaeon]|nr:dUTP diphosphatase [Candidatus Woesearchaeota archaeon]
MTVKFKRLEGNEDISLPKYHTEGSAAFDLHAAVKEETVIRPGEIRLIPTGFKIEFPAGYVAQLSPRSGLALKKGISLVNTPGLVDSDYRGEVGLIMINLGREDFLVNRNDRVAQMCIKKVEQADIVEAREVSDSSRGSGGYGSTGN